MQRLLSALRGLLACGHPAAEVQRFTMDKASPASAFPPRRLSIERCHECGAVRMAGDDWIPPMAVAALARALGVLAPTSPELVALAEQWREARAAGVLLGTAWQAEPGAGEPVQPADGIALVDLYAYDCAASGCVPPQVGVPVHAPHLRALLAAYLAVQMAAVVTLEASTAGPYGRASSSSMTESRVRRTSPPPSARRRRAAGGR